MYVFICLDTYISPPENRTFVQGGLWTFLESRYVTAKLIFQNEGLTFTVRDFILVKTSINNEVFCHFLSHVQLIFGERFQVLLNEAERMTWSAIDMIRHTILIFQTDCPAFHFRLHWSFKCKFRIPVTKSNLD